MVIIDLKHLPAHKIARFGSVAVTLAPLLRGAGPVSAVVFLIEPGGVVGEHPAATHQLFCVVEGQGWVRGAETHRTQIRAGQAAFWLRGEQHESGSESGMTALVVEGDELDPALFA